MRPTSHRPRTAAISGWQDLSPGRLDAPAALSLADALLEQASGHARVCWTRLSRPALILGRSAAAPEVDWSACRRLGLTVHRRRSGGGAVLWDDRLVSFDVVLPAGHPLLRDDIVAAYRWLGEALTDALVALGLRARLIDRERAHADQAPPEVDGVCFGGVSPWEVEVEGRKVVGLSQVRARAGALFPVGIPLRLDARAVALALGRGDATERVLAARAAGLTEFDSGLDRARVRSAVSDALSARLGAGVASDHTPPPIDGRDRYRDLAR